MFRTMKDGIDKMLESYKQETSEWIKELKNANLKEKDDLKDQLEFKEATIAWDQLRVKDLGE